MRAGGAQIFTTRTFLIWDAAGITSMQFGNPVREIVDYYEEHYSIGFTEEEKQDLTNLMSVL